MSARIRLVTQAGVLELATILYLPENQRYWIERGSEPHHNNCYAMIERLAQGLVRAESA